MQKPRQTSQRRCVGFGVIQSDPERGFGIGEVAAFFVYSSQIDMGDGQVWLEAQSRLQVFLRFLEPPFLLQERTQRGVRDRRVWLDIEHFFVAGDRFSEPFSVDGREGELHKSGNESGSSSNARRKQVKASSQRSSCCSAVPRFV